MWNIQSYYHKNYKKKTRRRANSAYNASEMRKYMTYIYDSIFRNKYIENNKFHAFSSASSTTLDYFAINPLAPYFLFVCGTSSTWAFWYFKPLYPLQNWIKLYDILGNIKPNYQKKKYDFLTPLTLFIRHFLGIN